MAYKKSCDNVVYIYGLIDPRDNEVFYIGYAENIQRRLAQHLNVDGKKREKNTYKNNVIRKIIRLGLKPELKIIDKCEFKFNEVENRYEHEILEIYYIKKYKDEGIRLTNLTEGGEGGCTGTKKVYQYSEDGKFLKEYFSINEMANCYNTNATLISKVIDQKHRKSYRTTYLFSSKEKADLFEFKKTKKDNISIVQYSLNGEFILEYKSQWDASRLTNISQANISYCLNETRQQAGGYMWYYKDKQPLNKIEYRKKTGHVSPVVQYTKDFVFIKKYESMQQASLETDVSVNSISFNARNIINSAGGYIWTYENNLSENKLFKNEIVIRKTCNKIVLKYDLNEVLLEEYSSLTEAEKANSMRQGKLSQILNGNIKNGKKFIWKYKNNN